MLLANTYPLLDIFWTMLVLFGLVLWLGLVFTVFADIVRRHDATGVVKAAWTVLILILPLVGVLIYLAVEGRNMSHRSGRHHERGAAQMEAQLRLRGAGGAVTRAPLDGPHQPG